MKIFKLFLGGGAAILLTGCSHSWKPSAGLSPYQFASSKAQCSYISRHNSSNSRFRNTLSYATGNSLGHSIANFIRTPRGHNNFVENTQLADSVGQLAFIVDQGMNIRLDFDDCMMAKGWIKVN